MGRKNTMKKKKKELNGEKVPTLNPTDLGCRTIAQLVLCSYSEDDGRSVRGGTVDVGIVQVGLADWTGCPCATIDPDESHLAWALLAGGTALLHSHIHGILQDAAWRRGGSFPRDVDRIVYLGRKKKDHDEEVVLLSIIHGFLEEFGREIQFNLALACHFS